MSQRRLKIMVLFDLGATPPKDGNYLQFLFEHDNKTEREVVRSLKRLGHEVSVFGIHDSIYPFIDKIRAEKPDLIFNLCEAFQNLREHEPNLMALLDLMNIPYTGCGPSALRVCKDKGMTKKILRYHNIRVPQFLVSKKNTPLQNLKDFQFPGLVKPLELEASEGISQFSLVHTEEDALERIKYIHDRYDADVILEEYIEGRELYVGILGNNRMKTFPARELFFRRIPKSKPKIATFRAKWNEDYREKWGIDTGKAKRINLTTEKNLEKACKTICEVFDIKGYARIDWRLSDKGELVFLEANPNPALSQDDDFAKAAKLAGMNYDNLIKQIINLAFTKAA